MANVQKHDTEVVRQLARRIDQLSEQVQRCGRTTRAIAREMDQKSGGRLAVRRSERYRLIGETIRADRMDMLLLEYAQVMDGYGDFLENSSQRIRQAADMIDRTECSIRDMRLETGRRTQDPVNVPGGYGPLLGVLGGILDPGDQAPAKKAANRSTYDDPERAATRYTETFSDDFGQYGANQGEAIDYLKWAKRSGTDSAVYQEYVRQCNAIITRNGKRKPADLEKYLENMNAEGCGYAAMTNCVFAAFEGEPAAFENTFGYPMYAADGTQNFDLLMLDIYSMTDSDSILPALGVGTSDITLQERLKRFCKKHNLKVETKRYSGSKINPGNYSSKVAANEMLLASVHNYFSDDPNSGIYSSKSKRYSIGLQKTQGHWITVTGIDTETGMMEVSSFGETYYFDPSGTGMDVDYVKVCVSRN